VHVPEVAAEPGCEVVILAARSASSETLVTGSSETSDGLLQLPSLDMEPEPETSDVTRRVGELLGCPVTLLRMNVLKSHDNYDAAAMIVEVEPVPTIRSEFLRWHLLDQSTVASVSPEWAAESVASWLEERTSGWSPLRPQWSRPGWLSQASTWMSEQMRLAGYPDPVSPQIHQVWGISVVLSASSASGTAYLKCSGDRFRTEPAVTRALSEHSPGLLPQVLATEPERGWMLMRDMGGKPLGEHPQALWGQGLDALQQLQHQWLGRTQELLELGAEDRPLTTLTSWVEGTTDDADLMGRLSPDEQRAWSKVLPAMVESCRQLDRLGPGSSLVHGDFHPWNAVVTDGGVCVFDWTDASVAHPFLDAVTFIGRSDDVQVRQELMRRYLTTWDSQLDRDGLSELTRLALVVGALHQVHTYSQLIPTLMPEDVGQLRDGDIDWIRRAMRFADEGLTAKY
jgi:hypothetical protein